MDKDKFLAYLEKMKNTMEKDPYWGKNGTTKVYKIAMIQILDEVELQTKRGKFDN